MKKVISLTFVVCATFILASCEDKGEVADEIAHYYNNEWAPINNKLQKEMRDINDKLVESEEEDKTSEAANIVEEEITPVIDEVLKRFKNIDPANKKIKKMNDMQIEADEYVKENSEDMIIYYEGGDVSEEDIEKYDKELQEKQGDVLEYRDKLMDEYELEEVEDDDEDKRFPKIKRVDD